MTLNDDTLLDDLADVDQVEDTATDEEVDSSGSDVDADDVDAVQDEENLNDDDTDSEDDEDLDSDEEDDDEDSEDGDDNSDEDEDGSGRNRAERQIAKKHAKMKLAEAEAEKLRNNLKTVTDRLEELEGSNGKVFSTPDEIAKRRSDIRLELDEIEDALDELDDDGNFTTPAGNTFSKKQLKQWKRSARRELEEALPAAERRLERLESVNRNVVAKAYPDILDPSSADGKEAAAILQRIPALKSDPEVFLLLGDMLRGKRLREKIPAKKKGKSSARRAPESRSPSQATRSVRRPKSKSGSRQLLDDLAALEGI